MYVAFMCSDFMFCDLTKFYFFIGENVSQLSNFKSFYFSFLFF